MSGSTGAKQDPASKKERALHSDGRTYFSYAQIHEAVSSAAPVILEFKPVRHRSAGASARHRGRPRRPRPARAPTPRRT